MIRLPIHVGYLALAVLVGAESMGVPLPGESALLAAGLLAHQGGLNIAAVIAVAAAAAVVGDNVGYLLGRRLGPVLFTRPGPLLEHRRRLLRRGELFFARHGPTAVFLARFFAGARVTAAWLAGANRMRWRTFLLWNALGGVAWAITFGLLGFLLGAGAERLVKAIGVYGFLVTLALVALAAALLWLRRRRARVGRSAGRVGAHNARVGK